MSRVKTGSKYFAHRLHCIRLATKLSAKTGVFIPIAAYVFEMFDSVEVGKLGVPSSNKPFDFTSNVRAPQGYIGTRVYQTGVIEQCVEVLYDWFGLLACTISFPETVLPAILHLKKYVKGTPGRNVVFNKQVSGLVDKLCQNRDFILGIRANVDFSPKNVDKVVSVVLMIRALAQ